MHTRTEKWLLLHTLKKKWPQLDGHISDIRHNAFAVYLYEKGLGKCIDVASMANGGTAFSHKNGIDFTEVAAVVVALLGACDVCARSFVTHQRITKDSFSFFVEWDGRHATLTDALSVAFNPDI